MPEEEPLDGNLSIGLGSAATILGGGMASVLALQGSAAALPWKTAAGIAAGAVLLVLREGIRARWPGWERFLLGSGVALILYWLAAAVLAHRSLSPWIGLFALVGTVAAAIALSTPRAGGLACLLAFVPAVGDAFVLAPGVVWYGLFSVRFAILLGVASFFHNRWFAAPLAGAAGIGLVELSWAPLPWGLVCALVAGLFALAVLEPVLSALPWASLGLLWRGLWKEGAGPERPWEILVTVAGFLLVAAVSWWLHRRSTRPARWIALSGLALVVLVHRLLPGQEQLAYLIGAGLLLALGFLAVRWQPWPAGDRTVLYPLAGLTLLALAWALPGSFPAIGQALAVPGLVWLRRKLDRPPLWSLAVLLSLVVFLNACPHLPDGRSFWALGILSATWLADGYFFGRAK